MTGDWVFGTIKVLIEGVPADPPTWVECEALIGGVLAVHKTLVAGAMPGSYREGTTWTITHVPSGYAVYQQFQSQQRAMAAVEAITPLFAWDRLEWINDRPAISRQEARQIFKAMGIAKAPRAQEVGR